MSALINEPAKELLDFIEPFEFGSGRAPTSQEMTRVDALVRALQPANPNPVLAQSFAMLEGMWRCRFTSSPYVSGLDRVPMLELSGVYQSVHLGLEPGSGHYFNIGELSRRGSVKLVCGERARINVSGAVKNQLAGRLESDRSASSVRLPFRKPGWQSILYLDPQLRVVCGNEGGLFVLTRSL
jgi:hypothetical protein